MALFDTDRGVVVIRLVYDGPALSGKTTTLRTLAGSLGRPVTSGDEAEGRTLYFDWLDYTGGRFEGYPIRCQVVSVPGQRLLGSRRDFLLRGADAVVFVVDSRRPCLEDGRRMLLSLTESLQAGDRPHAGIIVQANKRDSADAAPLEEIRRTLGGDGAIAITESTATSGEGLRETFVLAVRLALDRTRELLQRSMLPRGRPEIDSAGELLARLREEESRVDVAKPREAPAARGLADALAAESDPVVQRADERAASREAVAPADGQLDAAQPPRVPDATVPGGMIWPPVEGRIVLHEALAVTEPIRLERVADGSWTAAAGRWRLHSFGADAYRDLESARAALVDWARWHSACGRHISARRCILAADSHRGAWRLWQIVRGERTVRRALQNVLTRADPDHVARSLVEISIAFQDGLRRWEAARFPCGVDTLGFAETRVVYVGLAPRGGAWPAAPSQARQPWNATARVRQELGPIITAMLPTLAVDVPSILRRLVPLAAQRGHQPLGEVLAALLIES